LVFLLRSIGYFTYRAEHIWLFLAELFVECEMFQAEVVEKLKGTYFLYSNIFQKIVPFVR